MTKQEFCNQYLSTSAQQAMALHILPDGNKSLNEWQALWQRMLQQPVE